MAVIQLYGPSGHVERVSLVNGESAKIEVGEQDTKTYLYDNNKWELVRTEPTQYTSESSKGYLMISGLGYTNYMGAALPNSRTYFNTFYYEKPDQGYILSLIQKKRNELDAIERRYRRGQITDKEVEALLR